MTLEIMVKGVASIAVVHLLTAGNTEQTGWNQGKIKHSQTQPPPPKCGPNYPAIVPQAGY